MSSNSDRLQVGRTGRAHGLDGEIRVYTAEPNWDYFEPGQTLYLESPRGPVAYTIQSWRVAEDFAIAKFASIDDRTTAERLTNLEVSVEFDVLPELSEREFYHGNLEGRIVELSAPNGDPERRSRRVGVAEGVFETGANDVLVVDLDDGDELYVPMFEGAIAELASDSDRIVLQPLEQWAPEGTDL